MESKDFEQLQENIKATDPLKKMTEMDANMVDPPVTSRPIPEGENQSELFEALTELITVDDVVTALGDTDLNDDQWEKLDEAIEQFIEEYQGVAKRYIPIFESILPTQSNEMDADTR